MGETATTESSSTAAPRQWCRIGRHRHDGKVCVDGNGRPPAVETQVDAVAPTFVGLRRRRIAPPAIAKDALDQFRTLGNDRQSRQEPTVSNPALSDV